MSINDRALELLADRRAELERLDQAQILTMVRAYVQAWDKLRPEYEEALNELFLAAKDGRVTQAQVAKSKRLQQALEITRDELAVLGDLANKTITADVPTALALGGTTQAAIITAQMPSTRAAVVIGWDRVSPETLRAMIERTAERIEKATDPLPDDIQTLMKRELVRGIAVGANPRETARRMVRQSEGRFNGGLTRALTIARTETISAHNAGAFEVDKLNTGIMAGWVWGASLNARTCIACLSRHGTEYPVTEPGPEGHQNCRCTRIPQTRSWSDLGFDVEEPPSALQDSEQWFDNLTPATQRSIMGPERLRLYQDGQIGWQDLSKVQDNPGWRPSVVITPVKDLRKAA